jgi:hypothetical protein
MDKKYYISKSKFGKGVFASKKIKTGELIMNFNGKIISGNELNKVTDVGRNALVDPLQVSDNKFMLILEPYVLVNHSCNPNAGLKNKTRLFAIKSIKKDEEILYDYSAVWFEGFKCECGNKNCRGYVCQFHSIPKNIQKKYIQLGIVPKFILNKLHS